MSNTWKQSEGQIVNGEFPLHRYLGGSEHCAVFLTERREGELRVKAAIKLFHDPEAPENSELQLSRWKQAGELTHPHLVPLYEMGHSELGDMPLVYVVMEYADENLAQVLPGRALTPVEAREILDAVLDVLDYLHHKGFVHGRIKPANIMASGDQLKVSSDGLYRAGEMLDGPGYQTVYDPPEIARNVISAPRTMSPAVDVWSVGVTIVETLTQTLPVVRPGEQQDLLLPQVLQEPFLDIARHCLLRHPGDRWTVGQIAARLGGRAPMPQAETIPPKVRIPLPEPRPMARPSRPPANLRSYTVPIAVGFVLVLATTLAAPRLLRRHTDATQIPAATDEQPLVRPTPRQVPPQDASTNAYRSSVVEEERSSETPVPVPALIHPETNHEETRNAVTRLPAGALVHGEVVHQVTPEVIQSARATIRGTVKVSVTVNVDRSGNVENAELESPGPSKYFARVALQAAQLWKFKPPTISGRGVLSSWTLQFEFTRDETTVLPIQEMP